jgi:hypothetical protein
MSNVIDFNESSMEEVVEHETEQEEEKMKGQLQGIDHCDEYLDKAREEIKQWLVKYSNKKQIDKLSKLHGHMEKILTIN